MSAVTYFNKHSQSKQQPAVLNSLFCSSEHSKVVGKKLRWWHQLLPSISFEYGCCGGFRLWLYFYKPALLGFPVTLVPAADILFSKSLSNCMHYMLH